jgi:hypothetical protein
MYLSDGHRSFLTHLPAHLTNQQRLHPRWRLLGPGIYRCVMYKRQVILGDFEIGQNTYAWLTGEEGPLPDLHAVDGGGIYTVGSHDGFDGYEYTKDGLFPLSKWNLIKKWRFRRFATERDSRSVLSVT